jgi:hypothetical protein
MFSTPAGLLTAGGRMQIWVWSRQMKGEALMANFNTLIKRKQYGWDSFWRAAAAVGRAVSVRSEHEL